MAVMFIFAAILFDEEILGIDSASVRIIGFLIFLIAFLGFIHFGAKEGEEDEEIIEEAKRLRERDKELLELLDLLELNEQERFRKIAEQIAERHNKYGVTLTDPQTGKDLLAGMTDEQREKYRQFLERTHRTRQEEKERENKVE